MVRFHAEQHLFRTVLCRQRVTPLQRHWRPAERIYLQELLRIAEYAGADAPGKPGTVLQDAAERQLLERHDPCRAGFEKPAVYPDPGSRWLRQEQGKGR